MERVKSPDGREWEVRASRFRLPAWREFDFDPWATAGVPETLFALLVLVPVYMVVVPLAVFLAELPLALARGLFSSHRWVEAVSWYPQTMRITWRITDRRRLNDAFDRIAQQLGHGYEGLEFEGAEIVEMTRPAGLGDVSR